MSLTGGDILTGFSNFLDDLWASTTTDDGASDGTSIVDEELGRHGDNFLIDWFVRITEGANLYQVKRALASSSGTGAVEVQPGFTAQVTSGTDYQIHAYDPKRKFAAIDEAIIALSGVLPQIIYSETITLDGVSSEYAIPSSVRKGPVVVQIEEPLAPDVSWNLLSNPRGNTLTDWTLSANGAESAAIYTGGDFDLLIPKYDNTCTKITVPASTVVTFGQVVGDMSDNITAARAAGRRMTGAAWVYSRRSGRISLEIRDDNGQVVASSTHSGLGWELLTCTGDISAGNATTLTLRLAVTSGTATELYVNNAWFFYGDQLPQQWTDALTFRPRRDGTTQKITLPNYIQGRRQLRLIGFAPLSQLGTNLTTQVTNTVEVDNYTAEVLYAKAAQILLGNELFTAEHMQAVSVRVRVAEARLEELSRQWNHADFGDVARIRGPYG